MFLAAVECDKCWNAEVSEVAALYANRMKTRAELIDEGHHLEKPPASVAVEHQGKSEFKTKAKLRGDKACAKIQEAGVIVEQARKERSGGQDGEPVSQSASSKDRGRTKRKQRCYAWSRDKEGCPTPCPNQRLHECERCGSPSHKGKDCPRKS